MDYKLIAPRQPGVGLLEQILLNRGIAPQEISHFLHADESDVYSPLLLDNIPIAAKLLATHIAANDKALIVVDADCDGYCSSAIFLNYFHRLFPAWVENNIKFFIHDGKQHGLVDVIEQEFENILTDDRYLIICPDAASNDYEQHKLLREHGIDVLILDHHEAERVSEYAVTVNNQLCDYPNKSLCGGAIVYKFCCYFASMLHQEEPLWLRDLVALSLIGDMMSQKDIETHYLTIDGLKRINNPFFTEMMNRQEHQFEGEITPIGIAFYVVPFVNAMTRSGTMDEKTLLFMSMLEWRAQEMILSTKRGFKGQFETRVEQAGRTCINVKSRQKRAQDASLANIESLIAENDLLQHKILLVQVNPEEVDKNLAGLIANQLAAKYAHPTLILRRCEHETGITWEGSGRNPGKSRLDNLREFLLSTNLVEYAQGHASAFGAGIKDENINKFLETTDELLKDFDFSPCYRVDLELDYGELQDLDVFNIASYNDMWGQELDEPLIAIKHVPIKDSTVAFLGANQKTLRITLDGKKTNLIKFNITPEMKETLNANGQVLYATIIGKCNLNHYMGNVTPQILIEDIEITRKAQWDF